jgi:hypothetical protein
MCSEAVDELLVEDDSYHEPEYDSIDKIAKPATDSPSYLN